MCASTAAASAPVAANAAITAPILVPANRSTVSPAASSTSSTPMWANARAAPPPRTSPTERPAMRAARGRRSAVACPERTACTDRGVINSSHARRCSRPAGGPASTRSAPAARAGSGSDGGAGSAATSTRRSATRKQKSRQPASSTAACSTTLSAARSARSNPSRSMRPGSTTRSRLDSAVTQFAGHHRHGRVGVDTDDRDNHLGRRRARGRAAASGAAGWPGPASVLRARLSRRSCRIGPS